MMNRIIIWGFGGESKEIINQFKKKIDLKYDLFLWVDKKPHADYSIHDFFNLNIKFDNNFCFDETINSIIDRSRDKFDIFCEIYSRHWYPKFLPIQEYQHRFTLYFYYFYQLIKSNNINLVIFSNVPHEGPDYILYLLCLQMKVRCYYFYQPPLSNSYFIHQATEVLGLGMIKNKIQPIPENDKERIKDHTLAQVGKWFYMKDITKKPTILNKFMKLLKNRRNFLSKKPIRTYQLIENIIEYNNHYNYIVKNEINPKDTYVYFPLHLQPEMTTSALGERFSDQLLAIETLIRILPDHIIIYVKENPKQTPFMRSKSWFQRLSINERITFISKEFSTMELIQKSTFVATITGTAGFEALIAQKPVLLFGQAWYKNIAGVTLYDGQITYDDIVKNTPTKKTTHAGIKDCIDTSYPGVVDPAYNVLVPNMDHELNAKRISSVLSWLTLKKD